MEVGAQQQDAKHFRWHFPSPLRLRISKLLIDINELKLQHSRVLGKFIIPSAKRKTETQRKWLACGLSAQLLEEEALGFQRKPHGSSVREKAVASFGEQGWYLVTSSLVGINASYSAFVMAPEVFSPPPCWGSQRIAAGERLGQVCSVWTPRRGNKEGGPHIRDSWHLFGLSVIMG